MAPPLQPAGCAGGLKPAHPEETMPDDYILAIDNGTQSVRAILFDLRGEIAASAQIPLVPYFSAQPGWAEHDAEDYWQAVCAACQRLWAQGAVSPAAVRGVAVTTQRGTVVNLDRHGKPLRPAILWLDQRRTGEFPPLDLRWRAVFKLAGIERTVRRFRGEAEINWIRSHQPEIWDRTHKYLLLSGYLNYRLCGRFVDSAGAQVGYLPFDYRRMEWAGPRDWKWQALALKPEMLPLLAAPGSVLGGIEADAAAATGIRCGTPLLAAASDKACEAIGAGCLAPDIGCISYGTTATINTLSRKYVEVTPFIPPYPSALPGVYSNEVQIFRGYWMVNWFKEQFGHPEQLQALSRGIAPEILFDELVEAVPPGSMGLMLQPYWTPGIRVPGPEAKGAVIGFGDVHTRAHLYRAILEGLAYALREGMERIERRSGVTVRSLRVSGGGAQSDAALQLTADIFGLPAARPHLHETSSLGAAIDAAVGLRLYPDFDTAIQAMTRIGRVFEPRPHHVMTYDRLYHRVYRQMYARLQPLYQEIQQITGYPHPA
jgi:sugar (pentulose or hexulose) kinase